MKNRREEMLSAPVEKLICSLALPTILGMLATAVYSMTDTFFIGMLEDASLVAAVGIVFYFMSLVQAVGFLFGYGSGNYIARCIGREDKEGALRMAAAGVIFAVGTGLVIMGTAYAFLPELVRLLGGGVSVELRNACRDMLSVFLSGVPGMTGALCLYNQLRLQGDAGSAILGMGIGMALNMVLDPFFIFGLHMGISGAALATVTGQYAGLAALWMISFKGERIPVNPKYFMIDGTILRELFCGGSPNFLRQSITTFSGILLNHVAGAYGETVIAAFTVTNRITAMLTAGVVGFGQGYQSVCAVNYGAGRMDRVKRGFRFCVTVATVVLTLGAACGIIFAPFMVGVFAKEESVCLLGTKILRYECLAFPMMGYTTVAGMFLQNIGRFGKAAMVTSLRQGILFIPLLMLLPRLAGLKGVILVQPIADFLAFPIAFMLATRQLKNFMYEEVP